MADIIPPGAFPDVAKLLRDNIKRPDGQDATAFDADAKAKAALRVAANAHEDRLAAVEGAVARLPFPMRG